MTTNADVCKALWSDYYAAVRANEHERAGVIFARIQAAERVGRAVRHTSKLLAQVQR